MSENGTDPKGPSRPGAPSGPHADLDARIARARAASGQPERPAAAAAPPRGLGVALRLSTELLAGVVVGGGLGFFLDRALGTSPFGLIVFVMVGFAAGTANLIRAAARPGRTEGKPEDPGRG